MSGLAPLYSHASDLWGTPARVFQPLLKKYHFTIDGAADTDNHLLPRWYGPGSALAVDALSISWVGERAWVNPPYSQCAAFLAKGCEEAICSGVLSVFLIPSRTDTRYWHEFVWDVETASLRPWVRSINFVKGRIAFTSPVSSAGARGNTAPFPSVLIEFGEA